MKILYIYRNPDSGFSIGRVFRPVEDAMRKIAKIDSIYLPSHRASIKDLYINIKYVKDFLSKNKYDVIHITGDVYYLALFIKGSNLVVTVHDIGFYTNWGLSLNKILRYLLWMRPLKRAAKVTFISEKSYTEFTSIISLKKNQTIVIPNPVEPSFVYTPKILNADYPNILHVGTQPHKNLKGVITALRGVKCKLTIIGRLNNEYISLLRDNQINYQNLVKISDKELLNSYKAADIVSFPTFYEGFGMPIIEAQAIGRPIITSDITPMNIIAGPGAILVDPYDINSIKKGFKKALTQYSMVVDRGLKNVENYTSTIVAQQYYKLYKEITHEV